MFNLFKKKSIKLQKGDIFKISIISGDYVVGQIIYKDKNSLTVVIFEKIYKENEPFSANEINNITPVLFANTFDAKLYHGNWVIVGNSLENLPDIKLPIYKLGTDDQVRVEDFYGKTIMMTSDISKLVHGIPYRNFVAPIRVENAIKGYLKLIPWNKDYDDLLYKNIVSN